MVVAIGIIAINVAFYPRLKRYRGVSLPPGAIDANAA